MTLLFLKSLRFRLMLLVLVAVVPAWIAIGYTATEQKREAVAEIQRNVLQLAQFSAHEEEQVLQGTRQILIALANFVKKSNEDKSECSRFCAELLKQFRRYANIGAINSNGDVFCSAVMRHGLTNAQEQSWFRRALESGDFAIGDYQIGQMSGKPVLVLAYPYRSVGGEPSAVFAALDLKWLNRYIFEIAAQLPTGFSITQIDEKGVVIARQPDSGQWFGRSMIHDPVFEEILSRKTGVIEARDDQGISYVYAFAPLRSSLRKQPLYMIVGIPRKLAFADTNRVLRRNLILLGIVALAAILAAWFGSDLFIMRQIRAMAHASRRIADGEMSTRTGLDYESGELGQLARTFDEMAASLEQRQSERKLAEIELKRSQELFRSLSAHLQEVREDERTRIARRIHDDLGQAMTALKIDIFWLNKKLAREQGQVDEKLHSMDALINDTIETVHNVSEDLRPGILDDFGISAAIEWQADEFEKRTGMECSTTLPPDRFELSREKETNLFRIVQESLTNVIRHAGATKVEIILDGKDGILTLAVLDNGKGISQAETTDPRSFGLIGIKERAHSMGGQMKIYGRPNEGTRLTIKIPISMENFDD